MNPAELRQVCVNTIRFLSADAVEQANSGHPGAPMGLADVAYVLWSEFLRYHPEDPEWPNRDRVVLSVGHASMLLYSMLHLTGYKLSLDDLKAFRQWESITPGHPEVKVTPGVETTTGPLGAGFGNGVGMALAAKMQGARFNTTECCLLDPTIYILCGDGDMQEGITSESASLAGHLGLGNIIAVYDQNEITIAGKANLSMSEDVSRRFDAYGWHVQHVDGHDVENLSRCFKAAKAQTLKPSLIIARTTIGKGSLNKAGSHGVHGSPLGKEEILKSKAALNWPSETFYVPDQARQAFSPRLAENKVAYREWHDKLKKLSATQSELANSWAQAMNHQVPDDLLEQLLKSVQGKEDATRNLSGLVIQEAARLLPYLVGGSADLEPSTKTLINKSASIERGRIGNMHLPDPAYSGRNIHFGIREHAMGSICNGMDLFGGLRTFCGTFAVFSDYMRPSLRLAAISHLGTIFVFTHDSFWVGEDGPTHQPIEHAWAMRLIPNLNVWRPADGVETAAAWAHILQTSQRFQPATLLLTRQKVVNLPRASDFNAKEIWQGGYIVQDAEKGNPDLILVATGSENGETIKVRQMLASQGIATRHVSMPCFELFKRQPKSYRQKVLPPASKIVVIEAGVTDPWYQIADHVIGKNSFGASAPGEILAEKFGFTAPSLFENILTFWKQNND